jgi:aldehyde:ferredoxin oxidoreductase
MFEERKGKMQYGYMGSYVRVDLTEGNITFQTFSDEELRKYIGGTGLGTKILYDETDITTDPLGPENVLTFNTGPLVGTKAPNFGRYHVVTKSPLTGKYAEANSGGKFGPALRKSGYDGIIVTGKAEKPVYLSIDNGKVELLDAAELWGKDTYEVGDWMKETYGKTSVCCCIGPAGENLSRIAAIMNDGRDGRTAARCGVGAVMGSKNLKAIVVRGNKEVPLFDKDRFNAVSKEWSQKIANGPGKDVLGLYGTSCGLEGTEVMGDLPIKNWGQGNFEGAKKICGPAMAETILTKRYYCGQCVIGCGRVVEVKEGKYALEESAGPEYETLGTLGANLLIDDLAAISTMNVLCNRYGLDTISTGCTVSFAIEAFEKGLLTKDDLGGLELKWGDPDSAIALIGKIARREDFGYWLAEGSKIASEKLGGIAPQLAVHVRGLEFPAHDPRGANGLALQYITSPRGACHLSSFTHDFEYGGGGPKLNFPDEAFNRFGYEGKGAFVAQYQDLMALFDSLTGCKFVIFGFEGKPLEKIRMFLELATGWDITEEELMETGERIMNLKHLYNLKCGWTAEEAKLPYKMYGITRGSGGAADNIPNAGLMLTQYNKVRCWNEHGIPLKETLDRLGLEWTAPSM